MKRTARPRRHPGRIAIVGEAIYRRTVLMTAAHARSFSRCLAANPHVLHGSVFIRRSARATPGRDCYVTSQPFNPARTIALTSRFVADRRARAAAELHAYAFWPTLDWPGWYWCIHDKGPEKDAGVYLVHPQLGCHSQSGCKDMYFRCRRLGALCKHAEGLILHLDHERERTERQKQVS